MQEDSKEKGIDNLLEIIGKLPSHIDVIILGSGPEEQKIQKLVKIMKNIHYLGFQNKEKTLSLIRCSDILIQPSLNEGISSTVLEAMASETSIIASNVGGNKELIENDKNGILVDVSNTKKFTEEILNLLENKERQKTLQKKAATDVKNYDWSCVGHFYLDIYQNLLNKSK